MTSAAPSALFPALRRSALIGLAFGAVAVHLAVVGVLLMLHQRAIIVGTLSLGQAVLLLIAAGAGLIAARGERPREAVLCGMLAGAASGLPIAALTVLIGFVPLRSIFIALSPALFDMLSFGQTLTVGVAILIAGGAIAGLLGAGLRLCPPGLRRAVIPGLTAVVICGVFQELIQLMLQQYEGRCQVANRQMLMAENSFSGGYAADAVPATSRHVRNAVSRAARCSLALR
jgi:branched-chain amino acid transport system permease protein